ncbi:olfactory receptor 1F1-like [Rhinatrema bivittatum]|uniref:olfactory receptor 1F1-like n=1 Tax=Rhinatrema bivittatum TaxID=194408 RepID=UPI001125FCC2|nr:olfactory receptor 1F1-like [Rhinatrema bivittatum]
MQVDKENQTTYGEFILLGFSNIPQYQTVLFVVFLLILLITLLGNSVIITILSLSPQLHNPMYFFLGNLSFLDICLILVTVPQMLKNFLVEKKTISFAGCMAQMHFFLTFCSAEEFLLAVMAYDRYVAICNPMHYTMLMRKRFCIQLVVGSWVTATLDAILNTVLTSRLSFCGPNEINHFLCEMAPLFKLSCSDTFLNEMVIFTEGTLVVMGSFSFILVSYVRIITAILKIHSSERRIKAFSTCSSHLVVVTLYFGTLIFMYFRPSSSYSLTTDKVASMMYGNLVPMLNPFIYSLRNNEVKRALRRAVFERIFAQKM